MVHHPAQAHLNLRHFTYILGLSHLADFEKFSKSEKKLIYFGDSHFHDHLGDIYAQPTMHAGATRHQFSRVPYG